MVGVADANLVFVLRPMVAAGAGRSVANLLARIVEIDVWPRTFVSAVPAADAGHAVVLGPIGKRIVGRMHGDKSAPARDEGQRIPVPFLPASVARRSCP